MSGAWKRTGSEACPLLYTPRLDVRVRYGCGTIMNELARAAAIEQASTVEPQIVPSGRCAQAKRRARPSLAEQDRVAASSQTRVVLQIILIIVAVALGFWTLHRLASVVFVLVL